MKTSLSVTMALFTGLGITACGPSAPSAQSQEADLMKTAHNIAKPVSTIDEVVRILPVDEKVQTSVVHIETGTLVGESLGEVNVFRGVPYAKPPVGELRWRAPQKLETWVGARTALAYEPSCPQPVAAARVPNQGGVIGVQSEDCLYLEVYAPKAAKKAPVMVWLHGGAMFLGSGDLGSYVGISNAQKGVITVPINYRLGSLGNFAHPALSKEGGVTGNYAFMDAIAALEWVQDNIEDFGGDPDNVTIAGQSAGGFMIVNLLAIPSTKGLYHKAIIQSGARIMEGFTLPQAEEKTVAALERIGVRASASADELRSVSAQTLSYNSGLRRGFGVIQDGKLIAGSPKKSYERGHIIDVPLLVGANGGEAGFDLAAHMAKINQTGAKSWLYHFNYVPEYRKGTWLKGAIHSAEVMFTLDTLETSGWSLGKTDKKDAKFAKDISSCWVAFYKMDPSDDILKCADGFSWPAYSDENQAVASFTNSISIGDASEFPAKPQ